MKMILQRKKQTESYTLGSLYVDGKWECFTLEDAVRPEGVKIDKQTAIPAGTYKVIIDMSNRFKRLMPHVLDVPGFEGIRIHGGDTAANTEGCPLVADGTESRTPETEQDFAALLSKPAFEKLFKKLQAAGTSELQILNVPQSLPVSNALNASYDSAATCEIDSRISLLNSFLALIASALGSIFPHPKQP